MDMKPYSKEDKDWLKPEDVSNNKETPTMITIKNAGHEFEKEFNGNKVKQVVFEVAIGNRDLLYTPNWTSVSRIIKRLGQDSLGWVGKDVPLYTIMQMVGGKEKNVIYAVDSE